jgi:radical SAM superfamily enzyme YgiQ (UPF0313 family)
MIKGLWAKMEVNPRGFYTGDRPPIPADEIESPIDNQTLKYFLLASETNDVMLPASRGCPYTCGFCINSTREGRNKWRPIPLNKWLEDIDRLRNARIPIPFLQIGDDWLGNKARIIEVGVALAARNIDWHLSIRANQIDLELARNLRALRCVGVSIGAESGSDAILERMGKHIQVADTLRAARCLAEYGLKPLYYFIVGIPTETSEELRSTMNLADKLHKIHGGNCSIVFYGYNPQPGTKLGELAASVGGAVPVSLSDWCNYDRSNTGNPLINAIYYVAGLRFHRTRGDKTDQNFPGIRRLLILPFELLCVLRWKLRFFRGFGWEQRSIKNLLSRAASA